MTYTEIARLLRQGGVEAAEFGARQMLRQYGDGEEDLRRAVERRLKGEPLQYIFGEWEFRGLRMLVNSNVLIPRADTELLVDTAIELLPYGARVLELGTGSGCISVALALEGMQVSACDISTAALQVASQNAVLHHADVRFFQGDMKQGAGTEEGPWQAIVSNPPYIVRQQMSLLQAEVHYEPVLALDGGEDGLDFYGAIVEKYPVSLQKGGMILLEVGYDQAEAVCALGEKAGLQVLDCRKDLNGIQRVVCLQKA